MTTTKGPFYFAPACVEFHWREGCSLNFYPGPGWLKRPKPPLERLPCEECRFLESHPARPSDCGPQK